MKLRIAVCDDEATETEYLMTLTREWAAGKPGTAISTYDSAEAFLFAYDADKSFDILLLDIQMKNLDGITLAKRLRANGEKMQIIFVTGLPDFIAEGYEVSALHYLMKLVGKEKLFSVLDKALGLLTKTDETVLVETEAGQTRIYHRDVHYAEAFAHTTVLQASNILLTGRRTEKSRRLQYVEQHQNQNLFERSLTYPNHRNLRRLILSLIIDTRTNTLYELLK